MPRSLSLGKGSSFSSSENLGTKVKTKGKAIFGSSRWGGFNKNNKQAVDLILAMEVKQKLRSQELQGDRGKTKISKPTRNSELI